MSIQAILDEQAIERLPLIARVIKQAPPFEANQMRCYALKEINNNTLSLDEMSPNMLDAFEGYLTTMFSFKGWGV